MSQASPENAPAPYIPPPSEAPNKTIRPLRASHLLQWLAAGWDDLRAHPGISAFYGFSFWLMAVVLGTVFQSKPEYTMSIASGCLLLGPFLAMGLYDVSRRREQGLTPKLSASLACWKPHLRSIGILILVLTVLELLWGRASLLVFAVFFNTGMPSTSSVLQAVFNPENWEFIIAYTIIGSAFAMAVFVATVVSIPMILDRDTDAITAAITSIEVFFHNTGVMLLWGALITLLVAASLVLPWGIGLLLSGPLLGHASWHAYRGAVDWHTDLDNA